MRQIRFTPAEGGWLGADWGDDWAWLRFAKDRSGKLTRLSGLHVVNPTPARLRRIPFARIQNAVTMRGAGALVLALAMRIHEEPPPGRLDARPKGGMELERRYKLRWKRRQPLDDDFLADVAHAYGSAVAFGLNPRKAIVEDTGAADATVAGWIVQARKRGKLPKAKQGKVSA